MSTERSALRVLRHKDRASHLPTTWSEPFDHCLTSGPSLIFLMFTLKLFLPVIFLFQITKILKVRNVGIFRFKLKDSRTSRPTSKADYQVHNVLRSSTA